MSRARIAFGVLLGAALVAWLLIPTYPNYDSYYHLVWGQELFDGATPSFEAYSAPTQHPLWVAVAALAGVFGEFGERLLVLVSVLSHVLLMAGVFMFSRRVFDELTGWIAALLVGSSFAFLLYASRAYVDVPFLATVMWAAYYAADERRDGRAAMGLLLVAGLLRPEAWVLAGALWAWKAWTERSRRLDLLALAAVAPVLWALTDLLVTGDPLFSLHSTSDLATALGRPRGIAEVPESFVRFLADTARVPVALAGLAGMVLAWRARASVKPVGLPFALFAAGAITFAGTGIAGLSILPRYLTVPAIALCIFAAYALTRRRAVLAAAVVAGLAFVVVKADTIDRLTTELRYNRSIHADLVHVLDAPATHAGLRCGPLTWPNYRLVPETRWHLDVPAGAVGSRSAQPRALGVAMVVAGEQKSIDRYGHADGAPRKTNRPPAGFAETVRSGPFVTYVRCDSAQPTVG